MRCFWEQTGVLGPIYRLLGQGLNDARKVGTNTGREGGVYRSKASHLSSRSSAD
jgi:hypothetical protein